MSPTTPIGMYRYVLYPQRNMNALFLFLLAILSCFVLSNRVVASFVGLPHSSVRTHRVKNLYPFQLDRVSKSTVLSSAFTDASSQDASSPTLVPDPSSMSVKEIKQELKSMEISFSDCFDKDSLIERLKDARNGNISSASSGRVASVSKDGKSGPSSTTTSSSAAASSGVAFHREAVAADLRTKTVRQLRTLCAQSNIRWANLIEKEELVQALVQYQEECLKFSRSGKIMPGKVAQIDDDILTKELTPRAESVGTTIPPLLLDVFATWCGPCKIMSPFLEDAAAELGDKVRVAKIDSDQYPEWASKLNVRSLPTIIVFDGETGKELERVEGALRKDQLVQLAMKHVV